MVAAGGDVTVEATSTEEFFAIATSAGRRDRRRGGRRLDPRSRPHDWRPRRRRELGSLADDDRRERHRQRLGLGCRRRPTSQPAASRSATRPGVGVSTVVLVKTTTVKAYIGIANDPATGPDHETFVETQIVEATPIDGRRERVTVRRRRPRTDPPRDRRRRASTAGVARLRDRGRARPDDAGPRRANATSVTGGASRLGSDHTDLLAVAGALASRRPAGVGVGVDVEVVNKSTQAWIGRASTIDRDRNVKVDADSAEDLPRSPPARASAAPPRHRQRRRLGHQRDDAAPSSTASSVLATACRRRWQRPRRRQRVDRPATIAGNLSVSGSASIGAARRAGRDEDDPGLDRPDRGSSTPTAASR